MKHGYLPFTPPFNVTGHPAASLPAGLAADGLPVGLQVVAPRHADALLLAVSAAYERRTRGPGPRRLGRRAGNGGPALNHRSPGKNLL
ncbi:MAG: hypothetical protein HS107_14315 [Thermoflexaceae bacterium]|nr:hypothetical protein [Thermoflexaceae bacterium]